VTDPHLVFVPTPADVPVRNAGTTVVVLDTAWTPTADDRPDVVPLRRLVSGVINRRDLFHEALTLLDDWAASADLTDRLMFDGVSWWYRIRPSLVDVLHEQLVWAYAIDSLLAGGAPISLVVPEGETVLARVAGAFRAVGTTVTVSHSAVGAPTATRSTDSGSGLLAPWRSRRREKEIDQRARALDTRLDGLIKRGRPVMVIAQPRIYQTVRTATGDRLVDPQLESVIAGLDARGLTPIVVGLELDHTVDADWAILETDSRLYPQSLINARWPAGKDAVTAEVIAERIQHAMHTPLAVAGVDLAPMLVEELRRFAGSWLVSQLRIIRRAAKLLDVLAPVALFLNHEGIRTPWVAAARSAGVPVFAVQHGLIYERHAVYSHPRQAGLLLPDVTFTFGPWERDVLLEHGGYREDEVEVGGSPRVDLDAAEIGGVGAGTRADNRAAVRATFGIAPAARLLVVSTAHTTLFRRFYLPHMIDRLLGGPLPGVHVVFKQHPGERDDGPYRALVEGMARAGGYATPAITVVRDTDLYALLRAADAHLGLHSTVLTDAVVAETRNLISTAQAYGDLLGYVEARVAWPVRSVDDVRAALAEPHRPDPAARRTFLDAHFLPGHAGARIAEAIDRRVSDRAGSPSNAAVAGRGP
jgi:hypothetical protein